MQGKASGSQADNPSDPIKTPINQVGLKSEHQTLNNLQIPTHNQKDDLLSQQLAMVDLGSSKHMKEYEKEPGKQPQEPAEKFKKPDGLLAVDLQVPEAWAYKIYSKDSKIYSEVLNQTNIGGNSNKFYIMQLLKKQSDPEAKLIFFTRWGRVGCPGQKAMTPYDESAAISAFNLKRKAKLKVGYCSLVINQENDKEEDSIKDESNQKEKEEQVEVQVNIEQSVEELVKLVANLQVLGNQLKQISRHNPKKISVGKLAKIHSNLKNGYQGLKTLLQVKEQEKKQSNPIMNP